jgi:membrane protein YdbS with pleckstrin-like domain
MLQLRTDEHIIIVIRKHWIVLLERFLPSFLLLAIPMLLWLIVPLAAIFFRETNLITPPLTHFALAVWIMIACANAFVSYMNYILDMWIVTDQRLIDVEQHGLFSREVAEIPLSRIQDVSIQINGILRTFLTFGTVRIQTAGEREYLIHDVPRMEEIKEAIMRNHIKINDVPSE